MPVLENVSIGEEESQEEELILDGKSKYPLRRSLFPCVPPTIRFFAPADEKEIVPLPPGVRNLLKWRLTNITPAIVRDTVRRSGFKITKDETKWCAMWGKHMGFAFFSTMNLFQKINHFPGSFHLGRKDRLHLNLSRLRKNASLDLSFVPQTFLLPQEAKAFQKCWKKEGAHQHRWIAKPPASSRGTGVFIVSRWSQISQKLKEPLVVQRYIHKPFLIRGSKFDLRLYALVTGWNPLKVYVYKQGMLRFATMAYSDSVDSFGNAFMHLTNYSLNKMSADYSDAQKWTLDEFWNYLQNEMKHVSVSALWSSLVEVIVKTLISAEGPIYRASENHAPSRYSCFELFGFDVLLDTDLRPWLLEVNISPSMRASSTKDYAIKEPLIRDTLNLSGFRLPPRYFPNSGITVPRIDPTDYGLQRDDVVFMSALLHRKNVSALEEQKIKLFTCEELDIVNGCILDDLLAHDITILTDLEDELERANETNFVRVIPSREYDQLVPSRYANSLVSAWERSYGDNRAKGTAILQNLCRKGYHLPPAELEGKRVAAMVDRKLVPIQWKNRHNKFRIAYSRRYRIPVRPLISPPSSLQAEIISQKEGVTGSKIQSRSSAGTARASRNAYRRFGASQASLASRTDSATSTSSSVDRSTAQQHQTKTCDVFVDYDFSDSDSSYGAYGGTNDDDTLFARNECVSPMSSQSTLNRVDHLVDSQLHRLHISNESPSMNVHHL